MKSAKGMVDKTLLLAGDYLGSVWSLVETPLKLPELLTPSVYWVTLTRIVLSLSCIQSEGKVGVCILYSTQKKKITIDLY